MTKTEPNQSTVYANYSNDVTSDSSTEELHVCVCHMKPGKQILAVNPRDLHQNRLSHQYLNSSVTGQTYPDVLPDAQKRYPFFFTDTGLIDAPDFQSSMIFSATPTKDIATSEKPGGGKIGLSGSPAHHYYNKSSIFKPIALDNYAGIPANGDPTSFKIFQQPDGTAAVANKGEKDLDLSLFPPLSQLKCPFHKSSPMGTPQHHRGPLPKHHHSRPHEHQQLLGHPQPQATSYLFRQHYPPGHRPPPQAHRSTDDHSLVHHFTCGQRQIQISPVSLLWTFLSVLVAGTCLVSFLTPYWATHPDHVHSFGLFNLCVRDQRFSHPRPLCVNFGYQQMYSYESGTNDTEVDVVDARTVDITRIPSGAWQAACLLFGAGVTVQILGALTSLVVLGLTEPWHHRVALVNGYMQTVGVLLLLSGLLLYPVGFSSPFFSYYCDSTRAFCTGHCAMGWSYVTAVMATALSIFCPVMSSFAEAQQTTKKSTATTDTSSA
ncbi:unnamed protein product [Lymnaea stagnalis]|uniref:Uncharacterized protein n=1 Tax=Lymnaea stagnalis TaxID=6523 RepID=A0AAV2HU87_LYMST